MIGLSRWYDEGPLDVLRWINSYRYGWIVIAAIFLAVLGFIAVIYVWAFTEAGR
jgi:cytochrome bd-type quinol oxidase subunit 1